MLGVRAGNHLSKRLLGSAIVIREGLPSDKNRCELSHPTTWRLIMATRRDEKALSAAFARLPVSQQEALESAIRRRILRHLHDAGSQSPVDLAGCMPASLSTVSYHVHVLSACGLVDLATSRQVRGTVENHFVSAAADDGNVGTILTATEAEDGAS